MNLWNITIMQRQQEYISPGSIFRRCYKTNL